ncbi:MAG: hypothetical protein WBF55_12975 [Syntrophobacteria bacterium]
MEETTRAHTGRVAIRKFMAIAHALILRGHYSFSSASGQALEDALRTLSPEIYGSMNDPRRIELKGLEYILDRLPRGIEECSRFVMTVQDALEGTSFEKIQPPNRRRISYRVGSDEMSFVVTRGISEIYDILTHLTFLYIEAKHIYSKTRDEEGNPTREWLELERHVHGSGELGKEELEKEIWNLSMLLGRTYRETKQTYEYLERAKKESNTNSGLFNIIYKLGKSREKEVSKNNKVAVYFRPSLVDEIIHQVYGKKWAATIKDKLCALKLEDRPLHIISANLHSVVNLLYGHGAAAAGMQKKHAKDLYGFISDLRQNGKQVKDFARKHGFSEIEDKSGAQIDWQIIDTSELTSVAFHPKIKISSRMIKDQKPVLLIMDYAFGSQAFELMDELLQPLDRDGSTKALNVQSISVMGKAGILPGKKGDIMLATAHVLEGQADNYMVNNDLNEEDFDNSVDVYVGPIITVLGTSLQNRDILEKFMTTSWKAVGLEMEGGHYQRAIDAAIIRGHISKDVKVRYAYYASDNPLKSGQTLASGALGTEGIRPTYMITKAILQKIFSSANT